MERKFYLAYGSNLNLGQMQRRCPSAIVEGAAVIKNYRLLFRGSKTGNYLTIEPCKGHEVPVGVFSITSADELSLDSYEGFPTFYRKETFKVNVNGRDVEAMAYIMNQGRPIGVPSDYYWTVCEHGYRDFGFPPAALEEALLYSYVNEGVIKDDSCHLRKCV